VTNKALVGQGGRLAIVSQPLLNWLRRCPLPGGRLFPQWLAVLLTVGADITVVMVLAWVIGNSTRDFTEALPRYQARFQGMWDHGLAWLAGHGVAISTETLTQQIGPGSVISLVRGTAAAVTTLFANLVLVILTLVFALLESSRLPDKLSAAFGSEAQAPERLTKIAGEIQTYLRVKTLNSLATGILFGLWLWLLGVDFPVLWGFMAFVLNFIPNLGSIIAVIPPTLLALVQFGPGAAAGVLLGSLVINQTLSSLVEPQFMGRSLGLSPLVVFLSVVFWGWVWGAFGVILAVPITMIAKILVEHTEDLSWVAVLLEADPKPPGAGRGEAKTRSTSSGAPAPPSP